LPSGEAQRGAETILDNLPLSLRLASEAEAPMRWMADPVGLRGVCEETERMLLALAVPTPSQRLLADQTAKLVAGVAYALDGLTLLLDAGRTLPTHRRYRLSVPDWAPAFVNAGRAFVTVSAVEFFWVVTAWPNGAFAIVFAAIVVLLLSPRGDQAYVGALAFTIGTAGSVLFASVIKFAVLPGFTTFPAFCVALGLFLIPAGVLIAKSRQPATLGFALAMGFNFVPLLAPSNRMSYDTAAFYNSALAIFVGCAVAPLSFRLLPPLSPALRARRLLVLTLRDLRRLLIAPLPQTLEDWQGRVFGRLAVLPDEAEPLQRAQLLAALSVGEEFIKLRLISSTLGLGPELKVALDAMEQGDSAAARSSLERLDRRFASDPGARFGDAVLALRARANILALSEALTEHAGYFNAGAPA
jgi:uncharacterized membrane protein YccC